MMLTNSKAQKYSFHMSQSTQLNKNIKPTIFKRTKTQLLDYQIKETIGQGGFGTVKKAIHKLTGQAVAIKICSLDDCDQKQKETIDREVLLQRNLLHQNIAQIYQVIKKDNKIYIVMEYCKNGQLFEKINLTGPMPEKEAAKYFHQILSALIYIKQSGLSHRDIKPENIMFDERWNVKIIDFGFSCLNSIGQFRKTICGTPSYTAPEILKKSSYDAQLIDVWCLGVTLYAMLAAQLPFEGDSSEKRKSNILNCKYLSPAFLSIKAQKLFSTIFVDSKYRAKLQDLRLSQFSLLYEFPSSQFIDFKKQNPILEDQILTLIQAKHDIDFRKITESVRNCSFDRFHALYYLTLKNQNNANKITSSRNHDQFKKQRRGSLVKLQPISKTPNRQKIKHIKGIDLISIKTNRINANCPILFKNKQTFEHSKVKLRIQLPDSPRRLLDCLAAYKDL